ncbi:MAG: hypothetical protein AB8F34_12410 [Akkermansiaceae bacterium]
MKTPPNTSRKKQAPNSVINHIKTAATMLLVMTAFVTEANAGRKSDEKAVKAKVAEGGWDVSWAIIGMSDAENAKFIALCDGGKGDQLGYFKADLNSNIKKYAKLTPGITELEVKKMVVQALKFRFTSTKYSGTIFRKGKFVIKAGVATHEKWYNSSVIERYVRVKKYYGPKSPLTGERQYTWTKKAIYKKTKSTITKYNTPYVAFRIDE